MGAVYEVVDEATNGPRALKVMLPGALDDPDLRDCFAQEARITGAIESDHLVRVLDAGVESSSAMPFLVMDLLRGEDLGATIKRRGPLPPEEVMPLLFQVALALDKTHAACVVHRDLKPENLFLTSRDDGTPCVKILDFGIAKIVAGRVSARGAQVLGTPVYMAPEQISAEHALGPATDTYALAHVVYTLLVGEAYWTEEVRSREGLFGFLGKALLGIKEAPCARASRRRGVSLPAEFDGWFLRATALDPSVRFGSATAMVKALAAVFDVPVPLSVSQQAAPESPVFLLVRRLVRDAGEGGVAADGADGPPTSSGGGGGGGHGGGGPKSTGLSATLPSPGLPGRPVRRALPLALIALGSAVLVVGWLVVTRFTMLE